jgi:hypothetical protein
MNGRLPLHIQPSYAGLTRVSIHFHKDDGLPGHQARETALRAFCPGNDGGEYRRHRQNASPGAH